jgi:hypothetical protein
MPVGIEPPEACSFRFKAVRGLGAAIQNPTFHTRMATLRGRLGSDPTTGEQLLPESTLSPVGLVRCGPIYHLCGVLSDQDLFKRLRTRGQGPGVRKVMSDPSRR